MDLQVCVDVGSTVAAVTFDFEDNVVAEGLSVCRRKTFILRASINHGIDDLFVLSANTFQIERTPKSLCLRWVYYEPKCSLAPLCGYANSINGYP